MLFMVPALVSADDTVNLSGSYNLFAYSTDNISDYNDAADNEADYFYQRFRVATKITPADDITAYFRFDLGEGVWGRDFNGFGVSRGLTNTQAGMTGHTNSADHQLHVDYAWAKVDKEMWSIQVGQQYYSVGNAITDFIPQGIKLTIKTPVTVTLLYSKAEEGLSTNDNGLANEDSDVYSVNLGYAADAFTVNAFWLTLQDDNSQIDKTMYGAQGTFTVGSVNLNAEVDLFDGSNDVTNIDYVGLNLFLEARMNISDAWMVALQGFYAQGTDDPSEDAIWTLMTLDSFVWTDYGIMDTWLVPFYAMNIDGNGTTGTDAGSVGIQLITDFKVSEDLLLQGSVGYFEPEEDSVTNIDSLMVFNVSAKYTIGTNAWVGLQYNFISPDTTTGADDAASALMARFSVSF
jgi:hypothetical protein